MAHGLLQGLFLILAALEPPTFMAWVGLLCEWTRMRLTPAWGRASVPSFLEALAGPSALYSFGDASRTSAKSSIPKEEKRCPPLLVLWPRGTYYGTSRSGEGIFA